MTANRRDWLKLTALAAGSVGVGVAAPVAMAAPSRPTSPPATAIVDTPGAGHDYRPAIEALRRYVDQHLAGYGLPGMALSLADAEGFSAVISAGWADIDRREAVTPAHVFQIGSISKSFCALRTLGLVDAGKLSLDSQVADILPGLALPDGARITVRHLLTHSSGLPADAPLFPRGGGEQLWQGFEPGSQFSYSNTGYMILGAIVARLDDAPYHQALTKGVFEPLGLTEVLPRIRGADQPRYAASYAPYFGDRPFPRRGRLGAGPWINMSEASGCVAATSRQMAHYVRWLIGAGRGQGAPLLSEASRRLFTTPAIAAPDFGPKAQYAFGLAVIPVDGRPCLHHTGGMISFSSAITVDTDAGVGAFASVNARAEDDYRPREVTAYAISLMRAVRDGRPMPAPPPIPSATKIDNATVLAGRFRASGGEAVELAVAGDGLALVQSGVSRPLQPAGEGVFIVCGPNEDVAALVVRSEAGVVRSVGLGATLYTPEGAAASIAPELARLAGVYDSSNPWTGQVEVVARPDGLWLNGATPLIRQSDGAFRVGPDSWTPERVRFDGDLDGRPQRLNFSGADFVRI